MLSVTVYFFIMLNVIILNFIMHKAIMLSVITLSAIGQSDIRLCVIMLSVVLPFFKLERLSLIYFHPSNISLHYDSEY
jgi:hypothetical protein